MSTKHFDSSLIEAKASDVELESPLGSRLLATFQPLVEARDRRTFGRVLESVTRE